MREDDCCAPVPGRNVYLAMKSLAEARALLLDRFDWGSVLGWQRIPVAQAVGRVLAEPVVAALSSPSYHGSAMDGVALVASDTFGASEAAPRDLPLGPRAQLVNTGDVLPAGCDAVVMIEHVQLLDARVRIEAPAHPWQHVRRVGEDIVASEMLFTRHHRVGPYCVAALLAGGVLEVQVKKRPRVLIIPTGDELIDPSEAALGPLPAGRILEYNSTLLGGLVEAHGGRYEKHAPLPDDLDRITEVVTKSLDGDFDLVLVIGGSSAGSKDFTRAAVERAGEVLVHGVTMMPGKPTVIGAVRERPVFGIPGYPVSAITAFEQLVVPALCAMLGVSAPQREEDSALPTRKIASRLGMEEFVRVRLGEVGGALVATPLPRGSGTVTSIVRADGILRIPAELEGLRAGEAARVELLRPRAELARNLVAVGSHDLSLDVLADLLRAGESGVTLSSSHVGSLGGLRALGRGHCHLAGCHLLDPEDGSYNRSHVARYLPEVPVRRVHLVRREQGLMVPKGNPKSVTGFADLRRSDLAFVNRQAGSGTRVLLDWELRRQDIDPDGVSGYRTEEFTHMAVAVAVLSEAADVGLGIRAAAHALGLDFVPVASEDYELVVPEAHWAHPGIQALLQAVRSEAFAARMAELGGYETGRTGEIVG